MAHKMNPSSINEEKNLYQSSYFKKKIAMKLEKKFSYMFIEVRQSEWKIQELMIYKE